MTPGQRDIGKVSAIYSSSPVICLVIQFPCSHLQFFRCEGTLSTLILGQWNCSSLTHLGFLSFHLVWLVDWSFFLSKEHMPQFLAM